MLRLWGLPLKPWEDALKEARGRTYLFAKHVYTVPDRVINSLPQWVQNYTLQEEDHDLPEGATLEAYKAILQWERFGFEVKWGPFKLEEKNLQTTEGPRVVFDKRGGAYRVLHSEPTEWDVSRTLQVAPVEKAWFTGARGVVEQGFLVGQLLGLTQKEVLNVYKRRTKAAMLRKMGV